MSKDKFIVSEVEEKTKNLDYDQRVRLFDKKINSLLPSLNFDFEGEVLLNPNICVDKGYESGAITDPALVESIAKFIDENSEADPFIAESPVVGKDAEEVFEKTGYSKMRDKFDLINLCETDFISKKVPTELKEKINKLDFLGQDCNFEEIKVSKKVFEADQIVSVPSMKTHVLTTVTLSLKNSKGFLSEKQKKAFHMKGLAQGVVCLNYFVKPDLSIIDGVIGQEGVGPINGEPKEAGLLIMGENPVVTDIVGCKCMDIASDESGLVRACEEVLGPDKKEIRQNQVIKKSFEKAGVSKEYDGVYIRSENACSGCTSALFSILSRLESEGELEEIIDEYEELVLHKGNGTKLKGKGFEVAIGNCSSHLRDENELDIHLPGCPPIEMLSEDAIRYEALGKEPVNSTKKEIKDFTQE